MRPVGELYAGGEWRQLLDTEDHATTKTSRLCEDLLDDTHYFVDGCAV